MNIKKFGVILFSSLLMVQGTAWADIEDNRNTTIDSDISIEIEEAPENVGEEIVPQQDEKKAQPVERVINVRTAREDAEARIRESRPQVVEDIESDVEDASQGTESNDDDDSDSDSGSSSGSRNTGGAEISNEEIKEMVDKAVPEGNEEYKTTMDYLGAFLDGAMYHWGGPRGYAVPAEESPDKDDVSYPTENYSGQVGAGGDCSGLMSQFAALAGGSSPWKRLFATGNQRQQLSALGFTMDASPSDIEPGMLFMGWNGGHTAGTLPSGVKVESGGAAVGPGGNSINQYNRDVTAGGDDAQFAEYAYLHIDDMPDHVKWDVGVEEWEEYLDGVNWKVWDSCASPGSAGPVNPCEGQTKSIHEENGWTDKVDTYPFKGED